jgi:hypothetical protein
MSRQVFCQFSALIIELFLLQLIDQIQHIVESFTIVEGVGNFGSNILYQPSDFYLSRNHDPYNSWGVNAVKSEFCTAGCMEHWDWLPGITVYNSARKYTLPREELSAFAGTEWADNDHRVFHGIYQEDAKNNLVTEYLSVINSITGPRFAGWPFGYRQLTDAVFLWIHSETYEIHSMLLASSRQFGDKISYFNTNLYDPGTVLGSWQTKPSTWECREVIKFLYKAQLLLADGFYEIALVAASSAVETAFYEVLLYLEKNDERKAKSLIKQYTFLNRAKKLISSYGYPLPQNVFDGLLDAYNARNSIAHTLGTLLS